MGVPVQWVKNIKDQKQKELFIEQLFGCSVALDRLKSILIEELRLLSARELSEEAFDKPNWDYRQAYINGDKARLKKILDLINITKD